MTLDAHYGNCSFTSGFSNNEANGQEPTSPPAEIRLSPKTTTASSYRGVLITKGNVPFYCHNKTTVVYTVFSMYILHKIALRPLGGMLSTLKM